MLFLHVFFGMRFRLDFWADGVKVEPMPGYPSKKSPPVFPSDPNQPDPSVAQPKGQQPWSMKWVIAAVVVFVVVFNVYFFVFHDK